MSVGGGGKFKCVVCLMINPIILLLYTITAGTCILFFVMQLLNVTLCSIIIIMDYKLLGFSVQLTLKISQIKCLNECIEKTGQMCCKLSIECFVCSEIMEGQLPPIQHLAIQWRIDYKYGTQIKNGMTLFCWRSCKHCTWEIFALLFILSSKNDTNFYECIYTCSWDCKLRSHLKMQTLNWILYCTIIMIMCGSMSTMNY